jgi:hypothetical protein
VSLIPNRVAMTFRPRQRVDQLHYGLGNEVGGGLCGAFLAAGRGGSSIPTRSRTPTAAMSAKKRAFSLSPRYNLPPGSVWGLCIAGKQSARNSPNAAMGADHGRLSRALTLRSVIEGCEVELGEAHGVDEDVQRRDPARLDGCCGNRVDLSVAERHPAGCAVDERGPHVETEASKVCP